MCLCTLTHDPRNITRFVTDCILGFTIDGQAADYGYRHRLYKLQTIEGITKTGELSMILKKK